MASLIKRSNGIYYSITYVNGRRVWKSTGTSSRSKALLLLERNEVEATKKPQVITLEQFQTPLFNYLNVNLAHSTVLLYKAGFANFRRIVGDLPLTRYTPLMIEEFKITRIKEVSPVKVNIEFRTLKAAFNHAVNWGLLINNPFRKCKQLRIPEKRPAYLTKEEFQLLISVVDREWYREIIRFGISTMMRLGEIISLRWESIDIQKRLIYIENSDSFRTKTLKSRVIPMDELTHLALSKKKRAAEYVFTFPDGHPLSKGRVSRLFKLYCRKAGIREEIHFHSLRHTGATWLVQNNVPLFNVQRLLGHSKIEVTEIYSHLEVEHLRKPLKVFASLLS
jgi:integrase